MRSTSTLRGTGRKGPNGVNLPAASDEPPRRDSSWVGLSRAVTELLTEPPRASSLPEFVLRRATELEREQDRSDSLLSDERLLDLRLAMIEALGLGRIPRSSEAYKAQDVLERDGFRIEKLVFEVVPGLPAPAHLYVPATDGPHPAVVHAPGHWMENAKLEPDIQRLNITLVRSGIAVLCYDTLGQGERRFGWHQHGQLAPLLVGFTSLGVMVAESIAALDLLAARRDIDSDRVGITGTSGGGFSSIFAAAIDERIKASAIACIVNTHVGGLRDAALGTGWDGWIDLCNQVPRLWTIGSMGAILGCVAPRSLRVVHAEADLSFPLSGAREVVSRVRAFYAERGRASRFSYVEVPGGHGLHRASRDAIAMFLSECFKSKACAPEDPEEPLLVPPWTVTHDVARADRPHWRSEASSTEARCFSQPVDSNGPLVAAARARAVQLRSSRPSVDLGQVRDLLGPWPERSPLRARVSNHLLLAEGSGQRVRFESEPGLDLDAVLLLPDNWTDDLAPVFVMLAEGGKERALASAEAAHARKLGCALLLPDLRGTGEAAASEFELATASWMLDRDLLSQRVWDVVRCIDYLSERYSTGQQLDKGQLLVWGSGPFGLLALIAAVIDSRIAAVGATSVSTFEDLLVESSRVTPMVYRYRLLEYLDLDDLVRLAAGRVHLVSLPNDIPAAVEAALATSARKWKRNK